MIEKIDFKFSTPKLNRKYVEIKDLIKEFLNSHNVKASIAESNIKIEFSDLTSISKVLEVIDGLIVKLRKVF